MAMKKEESIKVCLGFSRIFLLILIFSLVTLMFSSLALALNLNNFTVWNNFKVFSGTTAPYASNGPGCIMGPSVQNSGTLSVGQYCPNNNDASYDLGAVWADMDTNYVAWQIYALNINGSNGAQFCGGNKIKNDTMGAMNNWGVTIDFDPDNNHLKVKFSISFLNFTSNSFKVLILSLNIKAEISF